MRLFLCAAAFALLIMQLILIFEAIGDIHFDRTTPVAGFVLVLINLIGVFFNVMTLRRVMCNG